MNKLGTDLKIGTVVFTTGNKFFSCASGNGMGHLNIGHAIYAHETDYVGKRRGPIQRIDAEIDVVGTNIYWWMQDLFHQYCNEVQTKFVIEHVRQVYDKWAEDQKTPTISAFKTSYTRGGYFNKALHNENYPQEQVETASTIWGQTSDDCKTRTGTTEFEDSEMERELQHKCDEAELNGISSSRLIEILTECMSPDEQREAWARIDGDIADEDREESPCHEVEDSDVTCSYCHRQGHSFVDCPGSDDEEEPEVQNYSMCIDCGSQGVLTGHQDCPFPGDHP